MDLSLAWRQSFEIQGANVEAVIKPGVRQVLGNGGLSDTLRSGANGVGKVINDIDRTVFRAQASLQATKGYFGASLGLMGEYGKTSQAIAVYGEVNYRF